MEVALGLGLPAFMKGKQRVGDDDLVGGFCFIDEGKEADDSSESSSIGVDSSSEDEDPGEEDEAQSKGPLGSFDSLEDSLPIKRGLSNFFPGKSKSFQSLAEVAAGRAGDVAKPENPFNKRRRIRMACKKSWSRRASCSSLLPPLPPLTTVEGDDDEDEDESFSLLPPLFSGNQNSRDAREGNKSFRSPRSFSLSDLQHV